MDETDLHDLLVRCGVTNIIRRNNNLMGCCPWHRESSPSWGISLTEPHPHGCFACGVKGVLATLLAHSGVFSANQIKEITNQVSSDTRLPDFERQVKTFQDFEIDYRLLYPFSLTDVAYRYMRYRGIPDWATKKAKCLYDHLAHRVLFPWYVYGILVGVTGRAVNNNKVRVLPYFATQKGQSLYLPTGKISSGPLVLTEGEVDAVKIVGSGFPNVGAIGFGRFTKEQKILVLNSLCDSVITFFDDDETGERLTDTVVKEIAEIKPVHSVRYKPFRRRYEDKLDPGAMIRRDIKWALRKCLRKNSDWPEF